MVVVNAAIHDVPEVLDGNQTWGRGRSVNITKEFIIQKC